MINRDKLNQTLSDLQDRFQRAEPLTIPVNIETITAYRCPGCKKVFIFHLSAVRHMAKCVRNPSNKTCLTCMNRIIVLKENGDLNVRGCYVDDDLVNEVRYYDDDNANNTNIDIVWNCESHKFGNGYFIQADSIDDAIAKIDERDK